MLFSLRPPARNCSTPSIGTKAKRRDWDAGSARRVGSIVERISSAPLQFPTVYQSVRRALLRRFPYMLFFMIDGDTLLVIACFHASRDPRRWQERV